MRSPKLGGVLVLTIGAAACGGVNRDPGAESLGTTGGVAGSQGSSSSGAGGAGGQVRVGVGGANHIDVGPVSTPDASTGVDIPLTGFTATESGGYKRGAEISGGLADAGVTLNSDKGCGVLVGVVRDFETKSADKHPDFESFGGQEAIKGLVGATLGADRKPVYASQCTSEEETTACPTGRQTTSQAAFDQWYRNTEGVNRAYLIYFQMQPMGNVVTFRSENFVPLDDAGWNDAWPTFDGMHNYGFTTELHIKFKYGGGETFTFKGDDDLWVFINGRLAIDLGGLHGQLTETINLDERAAQLGIEKGSVYPLELFHAERHSTGSHFRIDSTLAFVDCGSVPPGDVR
ncbi:MAG TPA: fibro-slime domain-containing protein [Polyangiaceae bacterium]|nr:fibro-slime domain-containing protein [Polyangiaceae bacterium]